MSQFAFNLGYSLYSQDRDCTWRTFVAVVPILSPALPPVLFLCVCACLRFSKSGFAAIVVRGAIRGARGSKLFPLLHMPEPPPDRGLHDVSAVVCTSIGSLLKVIVFGGLARSKLGLVDHPHAFQIPQGSGHHEVS